MLWLSWVTVGRHKTQRQYQECDATTSQPPCPSASWISSTFRKQGTSPGSHPPCRLMGRSSPHRDLTIKPGGDNAGAQAHLNSAFRCPLRHFLGLSAGGILKLIETVENMSTDKQKSPGMVRIRQTLKRSWQDVDSLNAPVWREVCLSENNPVGIFFFLLCD